jgi:quinol monooxygenase YgiN
MSQPFIYIGTYTVKAGKLDQCRKQLQELARVVEANEPRLVAFNVFGDEQGSRVSVVQVHPDAASMEHHMKVVAEHLGSAFDYLEDTVSEQVYGTPSEELAELLKDYADPNADVTAMPRHEAGFTRAPAARA